MVKIVVLVSGNGSNLQAAIDAVAAGTLDMEILAVVSNRRAAYALERAEQANLSTAYAPLKPYRAPGKGGREAYDRDLAELVRTFDPDWVICLGWMHLFTPVFLEAFEGRVVNLHPALPGAFPGKDAIGDAFAAFQRGEIAHTGCMMHVVVPEMDAGPVIGTSQVPILENDTRETLEARVHDAEHQLVVDVLVALSNDPRIAIA